MAIEAQRTTSNFVPVGYQRIMKVELFNPAAEPGQPVEEARLHIIMGSYVSAEARKLNPRNPVGNESIFLTTELLRQMGEPNPLDYFYDLVMRSKEYLGTNAAPHIDDADPAAAPYVPKVVTRRQARQALLLAGLLDRVPEVIAALDDGTPEGAQLMRMVQIYWDDSTEFQRDLPILIRLARALGLGDAALDKLFITAAGL